MIRGGIIGGSFRGSKRQGSQAHVVSITWPRTLTIELGRRPFDTSMTRYVLRLQTQHAAGRDSCHFSQETLLNLFNFEQVLFIKPYDLVQKPEKSVVLRPSCEWPPNRSGPR
jgi:hypothetical protein